MKERSNKQRVAISRNTMKGRLIGMTISEYIWENGEKIILYADDKERLLIIELNKIKSILLDDWDENTKKIINGTKNKTRNKD